MKIYDLITNDVAIIVNYDDAMWKDAQALTTGLQLALLKQDAVGRIIGLADPYTLNFSEITQQMLGYIETGYKGKTTPHSFEIVFTNISTGDANMSGVGEAGGNYYVTKNADGTINAGAGSAVGSKITVPDSKFVHIIATNDGTDTRIYVDGELKTTTPSTVTEFTSDFLLGKKGPGDDYPVKNPIGAFKVYDKVLTDEEVQERYDIYMMAYDCKEKDGSINLNPYFDCGLTGWKSNEPTYTGTLTDNLDGTVTVTPGGANPNYFSINPNNLPYPAGTYDIKVVVSSITGNGKMSYKVGTTWTTLFTYTSAGTYAGTFTTSGDIVSIDIGADADASFVGTFDEIVIRNRKEQSPDWWKISTLDEADILEVWDFGWDSHFDEVSARTGLLNLMRFETRAGSPTMHMGEGYNFGGAGAADVQMPELDWTQVSFVVHFDNWIENGTLDALFSHFNNNARYVLQQDLNAGQLKTRWSCGDNASGTYELFETESTGVYAASGNKFYKNGEYKGEAPSAGTAVSTEKFVLGALHVDDNGSQTQFSKVRVKKLLLVNRLLTDAEQLAIYNAMIA